MYGDDSDTDASAHDAHLDSSQPDFAAANVAGSVVPVDAPVSPHNGANQLTLSFHGDVYMFDHVPPERVQAVLLLLGGSELTEANGAAAPHFPIYRDEYPKSRKVQRLEALNRYREKKRSLNFQKKVLYECRQEVACRMKRHKGQFASSKASSVDGFSASVDGDFSQSNGQEEAHIANCQHCGKSKDATPMMRRGPSGVRSLCNACGLMWANKKTLKNISPATSFGTPCSSASPKEQI